MHKKYFDVLPGRTPAERVAGIGLLMLYLLTLLSCGTKAANGQKLGFEMSNT